MDSPDTHESSVKTWVSEVRGICKQIFCHTVYKWGGIKCEDHRMSTILPAVLIMSLFVGGSLGVGFTYLMPVATWAKGKILKNDPLPTQQGSSIAATSIIPSKPKNPSPRASISSDAKACDFKSGSWKLWLGNLTSDVDDTSYYLLPSKSRQALLKYQGEINDISVCEFTFIPRGEKAINYVISFDGIYQVVIGDNDYRTISLGASDVIDGEMSPVKESKIEKTRPRLQSIIKRGSTVKTRLKQSYTTDGNYQVEATVTYMSEDNEENTDTFTWIFKPSPAIDLHPINLSVGLIRAKGDLSEIGVNFISPNPSITTVDENKEIPSGNAQ